MGGATVKRMTVNPIETVGQAMMNETAYALETYPRHIYTSRILLSSCTT